LDDGITALLGPKAPTDCAGIAEGGAAAVALAVFLDHRPDLATSGLMDDALLWDVGGLLRAALLGVDSVMADSTAASVAVKLATGVSSRLPPSCAAALIGVSEVDREETKAIRTLPARERE
jgi:CBS-domain-containing membrane protein